MSDSRHADHEALSAFVDGEAPEWADHVAGCEECRASAARLRALALAVGRPVSPPAAADRDAAIAAALDLLPATAGPAARGVDDRHDRHEVGRARAPGRRAPRPWAMPAAAAVVVGLLGLSGFVVSAHRSTDETTVAGAALDSAKAESGGGPAAAAPDAPVGDLGDVSDAATLLRRALPGYAAPAASTGRASSSANSGASSDSSTALAGPPTAAGGTVISSGAATGATGGAGSQVAPVIVGSRPCEEQARARDPGLGPVIYYGTARKGSVDGYVLGFTRVGSPSSITLLLLARNGCGELLRAAGP